MSIDEIIAAIDGLTVLELVELKDKLQDKYGVTAAAPVAFAGAAAGEGAAVEDEKDSFSVVLEGDGGNKIQVIKAVREITSLGLKEAKELVESAPGAVLAEDLIKEDAEKMQQILEQAGAQVKLD